MDNGTAKRSDLSNNNIFQKCNLGDSKNCKRSDLRDNKTAK